MRVFIVGNDRYERNPLSGCINDAESWRKFFSDCEDMITLQDANKTQMLDGLKWLAEEGGIFCYSGHGTVVRSDEPDGYSEAMCCIDFSTITDRELASVLMPAGKRVTCILDCCHAGDEFRVEGTRAGRFIALEDTCRDIAQDEDGSRAEARTKRLWADTNVVLLGACRSNQSALEVNVKNVRRGAFSYSLQATYRQQGIRAWTNEAGAYIKRVLQKNGQVPRAIGKTQYLNETLIQEG